MGGFVPIGTSPVVPISMGGIVLIGNSPVVPISMGGFVPIGNSPVVPISMGGFVPIGTSPTVPISMGGIGPIPAGSSGMGCIPHLPTNISLTRVWATAAGMAVGSSTCRIRAMMQSQSSLASLDFLQMS